MDPSEKEVNQSKPEPTCPLPTQEHSTVERLTGATGDEIKEPSKNPQEISPDRPQERTTGTMTKDITTALKNLQLTLSQSPVVASMESIEKGLDVIEERLAQISKIALEEVSTEPKRSWPTSSLSETQENLAVVGDSNVKSEANERPTGTKPKVTRFKNAKEANMIKEEQTKQTCNDPCSSTSREPVGWYRQNLLSQPLTSWPSGSSAELTSTGSESPRLGRSQTSQVTIVSNRNVIDLTVEITPVLKEQVVSSTTDDNLSEASERSKVVAHVQSSPRKKKPKGRRGLSKGAQKNITPESILEISSDQPTQVPYSQSSHFKNKQRKLKGRRGHLKEVEKSSKSDGERNQMTRSLEKMTLDSQMTQSTSSISNSFELITSRDMVNSTKAEFIILENIQEESRDVQGSAEAKGLPNAGECLQKSTVMKTNSSSSSNSETSNEPGSSTESDYVTLQRVRILGECSSPPHQQRVRRGLRSGRRSFHGQRRRGGGRGERQLTPDEHWPRLPRSSHQVRYPTRYIRSKPGAEGNNSSTQQ